MSYTFHVINCRFSPQYHQETHTGRCLFHRDYFFSPESNLNVGCIVKISLEPCGTTVMCTAWPDVTSNNMLSINSLVLDAMVIVSKLDNHSIIKRVWTDCTGKVLWIYPSKICASLQILKNCDPQSLEIKDHTVNSEKCTNPLSENSHDSYQYFGYSGLPIVENSYVMNDKWTKCHTITSCEKMIYVHKCQPPGPAIITPFTLISSTFQSSSTQALNNFDINLSAVKNMNTNNSKDTNINTRLVSDLLDCLVKPYVNSLESHFANKNDVIREFNDRDAITNTSPSLYHLIRGCLLIGPPGCGKTHSAKALQSLCQEQNICRINIYEISIPELLASENPVKDLNDVLRKAEKSSFPTHRSSSSIQPTASHQEIFITPVTGCDKTVTLPVSEPVAQTPKSKKNLIEYKPQNRQLKQQNIITSSSADNLLSNTILNESILSTSTTAPTITPTPASNISQIKSFSFLSPKDDDSSNRKQYSQKAQTISHQSQSPSLQPEISLIIIDEIDALGKSITSNSASGSNGNNRSNPNDQQIVIINHLKEWFDRNNDDGILSPPLYHDNFHISSSSSSASMASNVSGVYCCIIATTNRPDDVDGSLRRGGRLEKEIEVVTLRNDRLNLLLTALQRIFTPFISQCEVAHDFKLTVNDIKEIINERIDRLGGYVAADCQLLVRETSILFMQQISHMSFERNINDIHMEITPHNLNLMIKDIFMKSLEKAMVMIQPSSLRGATMSIPSISFDDIIGESYDSIKRHLHRCLVFSNPKKRYLVEKYNLKFPGGILLHGPPGNSKTSLILAAASTYGLPVISLSAADVYSPYVGDAEAEIRKAFRLARQSSPCILLLDEIDGLVTNRSVNGSGDSNSAESRVLATLLTEMDGVLSSTTSPAITADSVNKLSIYDNIVYLFATTNRLESIDKALLRKGRLYQVLYVPSPSPNDILKLVEHYGRKYSLSLEIIQDICIHINQDLNPNEIANNINSLNYKYEINKELSGADIENICREESFKIIRNLVHNTNSSKYINIKTTV